jgi:hypothetical protein
MCLGWQIWGGLWLWKGSHWQCLIDHDFYSVQIAIVWCIQSLVLFCFWIELLKMRHGFIILYNEEEEAVRIDSMQVIVQKS